MIAEITVEKKYQSRAFLILPMSFNVAGILGPRKFKYPILLHTITNLIVCSDGWIPRESHPNHAFDFWRRRYVRL